MTDKSKIFKVVGITILIFSLPLALFLVKHQQENRSHAAPPDQLETEAGVLSGNAIPQSDSNASGGNYVVLGINQTSTPTSNPTGSNCSPVGPNSGGATAVATFNSIGLYWSPAGGAIGKQVLVKFRKQGECTWKDGLPMKYYPISGVNTTDYRGSIVSLTPNTPYEIQLTLEGTSTTSVLTVNTWNENFPVGATTKVNSQTTPYDISQGGTATAYKVYDGTGSTIDVNKAYDNDITVNANYVIIRGFTLKGANIHAIKLGSVHDVIIENCDISGWGKVGSDLGFGENYDGGVYGGGSSVQRIVVQRCKIHNPSTTANNWSQPWVSTSTDTHPRGPQCIVFFNPGGNNVLRYNECWSDANHHFNDGFGGGDNSDLVGYPGPDSDVYNNYVADTWDDGLEIEGGGRNVRIFNNYVEDAYNLLANASVTVGPLYIWNNVTGVSNGSGSSGPGEFLKAGYSTSETTMNGPQYLFNNTILQPNGQGAGGNGTAGSGNGRQVFHTMSRNNLYNVRTGTQYCISNHVHNIDNDFDYDLCSTSEPPNYSGTHGIIGIPSFLGNATFDFNSKSGDFRLSNSSKGFQKGISIPNFTDGLGANPDMGAQDNSIPLFKVGVNSTFTPTE